MKRQGRHHVAVEGILCSKLPCSLKEPYLVIIYYYCYYYYFLFYTDNLSVRILDS